MDAHFNEYLAAVVGMQDLYGHTADDRPTEFHGEITPVDASVVVADPARPLPASI